MKHDFLSKRFEKIPVSIYETSYAATTYVADEICRLITEKQAQGKPCVLGLATGATQVSLFKELIKRHQAGLSFRNVIVFVPDEFYPIQADSVQSHRTAIYEGLIKHVDILSENFHTFDAQYDKDHISEHCKAYVKQIEDAGGIDIQILGLGRTGHIGFNEPGSSFNSDARLITLNSITKIDAAGYFYGEQNVPKYGITLGIGNFLKAKRIILLAWGENKAATIRESVEGDCTEHVPMSALQKHSQVEVIIDEAAALELTRVKTPWLVGECCWDDDRFVRKAVLWLCNKVNKPILKLLDRDYVDHGMGDLITKFDDFSKVNIKIFNDLQHTITGWPGGKPNVDDSTRPERALPYPKRVVIFSPHPDDDVISMGGTFARLVKQNHDVHVAYQTSGNIAVADDDVIRFLEFTKDYQYTNALVSAEFDELFNKVKDFIKNKKPSEVDIPEVRKAKGAIRRGEAKAGCYFVGVPERNIHFLDMPFYETGAVKKNPFGEQDVKIICDLLQEIKPHQIYAAGDLSDPHGTHRVCMEAILAALEILKNENWMKECRLWLYRGAWQEWDLDRVDMAVPLSPDEVLIKRRAIYKHQSQKEALFPGSDQREFWQRAEDRNHATAVLYDNLGMAEYQAIEVFVKYDIYNQKGIK